MNRNIIYIINPISGARSKSTLPRLIEEKSRQLNVPFSIYPSVAGGDYSFLQPIIAAENITDIVIAGGDGTVSQVVGSLMQEQVNFGIIPCGSGNGLALAAKIPRHPAKALDVIFNGAASPVDGFFLNKQFACMLAGLGFDAKVAHDFTNEPKRGLLTYIKLSLKNFFSMHPHRFTMMMDKTEFDTEAYFISIANSNQFGNNFTIAPKASLSDGLLDIVIVTRQNKVSFILQTLGQLAGWNRLQVSSLSGNKRGVIYFQTDKLEIINHQSAPLHIDGDPAATAEKIKIEVSKKCFRLIQPL
jgi:YegS/Rv2252/BmrU family lipid kinase